MPYGPKGEWRPADDRACSVHIAKLATGQIEETYAPPRRVDVDHAAASKRASAAAKARAAKMPAEERSMAARRASQARWGK